jgi:hypothetical protein
VEYQRRVVDDELTDLLGSTGAVVVPIRQEVLM